MTFMLSSPRLRVWPDIVEMTPTHIQSCDKTRLRSLTHIISVVVFLNEWAHKVGSTQSQKCSVRIKSSLFDYLRERRLSGGLQTAVSGESEPAGTTP